MKTFSLIAILLLPFVAFSQYTVHGTVTDSIGNPVSFSSILIKGSRRGTTSNIKGEYTIQLNNGNNTLSCQHVGYKTIEKKITENVSAVLNFTLIPQAYNLNEVVIKSNGEDPAYAIIRNAIKKRKSFEKELQKLTCDVYIKGQLQLRDYPKKFFGETVDFEDGDTAKKKMIFLSESVAKYARDNDKRKIEVISTKVSGQKDGFGFSSPQIISFYNNIVFLGSINPRGFISPISDNALYYYKFKFKGTFYENGKEISHIEVIPKRKYEPLFSGFINIVENEWRIEGIELMLLKENQMQLLDTFKIEQLYVPEKSNWIVRQQVVYPSGNIFGFKFFGNFLQVYDKVNLSPSFTKNFFDNTIMKFEDSANKKSLSYWDSVRPVPLLQAEIKDYKKKDSLEVARQSPHYLDSLDKRNNKITFSRVMLTGQSFENRKKKATISFQPLMGSLSSYNTVEGYVLNFSSVLKKEYDERKHFTTTTSFRYGLSNHHLNANAVLQYNYGKKYLNSISVSGGTDVFQFNNQGPIDPFINTLSTLFWTRNYMKLYEASFGKVDITKAFGGGITLTFNAQYQYRSPLENSANYYWSHFDNRNYSPNYPTDITSTNIQSHSVLTSTIGFSWQPGCRYIQFPNRIISIGSKYPVFHFSLTGGSYDIASNAIDFAKWRFAVNDHFNLKLLGRLDYKLAAGGFLNDHKVNIIDYNHFSGNQTAYTYSYLNGYQLLPYYAFSNKEKSYLEGHVEYHLNGLLTNKIPGFRKLNWYFVLSGNSLFVNPDKHYYEIAFGIENILKVIRIDGVQGFLNDGSKTSGIRFSMPLHFNNGR